MKPTRSTLRFKERGSSMKSTGLRQALAIEERNLPGHLPYAPQAAKQLASLAQALSESARRYKTLPDELQLTLDAEVETVLLQDPLLAASVSASARPLVVSRQLGAWSRCRGGAVPSTSRQPPPAWPGSFCPWRRLKFSISL